MSSLFEASVNTAKRSLDGEEELEKIQSGKASALRQWGNCSQKEGKKRDGSTG